MATARNSLKRVVWFSSFGYGFVGFNNFSNVKPYMKPKSSLIFFFETRRADPSFITKLKMIFKIGSLMNYLNTNFLRTIRV